MDEETSKAIEEAMNIFHKSAQEQPESKENDEQGLYFQEPEPSEAEESTSPSNTRRWLSMTGLVIGGISLTMLVMLVIVPLFRPSAIVTIIPSVTTIQTTTTLQVQSRTLSTVTLTQARTVPTTGTGHQEAQAAHGAMTFFNAAPTVQTVAAGTVLTGRDGVQVVTEQDAMIPAGNLSTNGQATVSAHVLQAGPAGNIAAGDIYGACCRVDVLVANATFTGGQDARTFPMVTASDLDNAITP